MSFQGFYDFLLEERVDTEGDVRGFERASLTENDLITMPEPQAI